MSDFDSTQWIFSEDLLYFIKSTTSLILKCIIILYFTKKDKNMGTVT